MVVRLSVTGRVHLRAPHRSRLRVGGKPRRARKGVNVRRHSGDLQCKLGNLGELRKRRGPAGDRRALVSATLPDRPERFDDDDGALRVGYR